METTKHRKEQLKKKMLQFIGKTSFARKSFTKKFNTCLAGVEKECCTSIHVLSIFAWYQIQETGDVTLLMKEKRDMSIMEFNALRYIFTQLRNEFIKVIGWDEITKNRLELIRQMIELHCELKIKEDDKILSKIKRLKVRLDKLNYPKGEGGSLIETCINLEKFLKVTIDVDKCSVVKFYGYLRIAQKQAKK